MIGEDVFGIGHWVHIRKGFVGAGSGGVRPVGGPRPGGWIPPGAQMTQDFRDLQRIVSNR
jgi:hypothetical protein